MIAEVAALLGLGRSQQLYPMFEGPGWELKKGWLGAATPLVPDPVKNVVFDWPEIGGELMQHALWQAEATNNTNFLEDYVPAADARQYSSLVDYIYAKMGDRQAAIKAFDDLKKEGKGTGPAATRAAWRKQEVQTPMVEKNRYGGLLSNVPGVRPFAPTSQIGKLQTQVPASAFTGKGKEIDLWALTQAIQRQ